MKWGLFYIPESAPDTCASCCMLAIKEGEPEERLLGRASGRMPKLKDDLMQRSVMDEYVEFGFGGIYEEVTL
ncbi:hypothetical protein [Archaeoglobus sp.]